MKVSNLNLFATILGFFPIILGIQKINSKTVTSVMIGELKKDPKRDEFFRLIRS